jgi:hypothetical protein
MRMISLDKLAVVADDPYTPLDVTNIGLVLPEAGITVPDQPRFRPYGVELNNVPKVLGLDDDGEKVAVTLGRLPGFRLLGEVAIEDSQLWPVVAIDYYKPGEVDARLVALHGFGFGVHPGHRTTGIDGQPETPALYAYGTHVGSISRTSRANRGMLPPAARQIKHFSLARIVGGPLGDPRRDAAFRKQMGIPEVQE